MDAVCCLAPCLVEIAFGDERLGLAVLQLEGAQLAPVGGAASFCAESLSGVSDLAAARGERFKQLRFDACDLEVAGFLPVPGLMM